MSEQQEKTRGEQRVVIPASNKVETIVFAYLDGGKVEFTLVPDDDTSADNFHGRHIHLPKDSGPHQIDFRIVDSTKLKLNYADDPIWIDENVPCPAQTGIKGNQVQKTPTVHGKTLSIVDLNFGAPVEIGYRLNFVDENGAEWAYDPIIINDGGVGPFNFS